MTGRPIVPVVLFGFDRPASLARVLAALEPQRPDGLIVVVDGPRDAGDLPAVESCRRLAREIDWVETQTVLHQHNRGCAGVPEDIDRIFDEHEAAIFVEDDCLPMPAFLDFMRQGLERYRQESRVFSLCGYQPVPYRRLRGLGTGAVGTSLFRAWGWASWNDRWRRARAFFAGFGDLFDGLDELPDSENPNLPALARQAAAGRNDYWDIMLSAIGLHTGSVNLVPTRGLVRNIGVGAQGAHQVRTPPLIHNRNLYRGGLEGFAWPDAGADFADYRRILGRYLRWAQRYRGRYRAARRRLDGLRFWRGRPSGG